MRFDSCNIQLSHYNFTSITCEKSASNLTLPNSTHFVRAFRFPPVVTLEIVLTDDLSMCINTALDKLSGGGCSKVG